LSEWLVNSDRPEAGTGTVTSFSFINGNGFTGVVLNQSTTPSLELFLSDSRVMSANLVGLASGTNTPITSSNSLIIALANLQAQIDAVESSDVDSVFGRTGNVVAQSGDYNTSLVTENTNLYFTQPRVLSTTLTGLGIGSNTPISSSDTTITAFANLQAQISAGAGGTTGSGTANEITYWSGTTTLTSNSSLKRNSVGGLEIGTGTFLGTRFLEVIGGSAGFKSQVFISDSSDTNTSYILARTGDGVFGNVFGNGQFEFACLPISGTIFGTTNATPFGIATNDTIRLWVNSSGFLGIGTAPVSNVMTTIKSSNNTTTNWALRLDNSDNNAIAYFRSDRRIAFGTSGFLANTAFTYDANAAPLGSYITNYTGAGVLSVSTSASAVGFYTTQSGKFGIGYDAEMTGEDQKGVSLILSGTGTDGSGIYIENNTGSYDSITVTDGGRRFRINENSLIIYEDGNQSNDFILISDANGLGRWGSLSSIAGAYVPYTGATSDVALGSHSLTARSVTIGSSNNTIVMGSTAGVASTISSTSNATKGTITIGGIASIDEANLRFRVGTPTTNDTNADTMFSASATNKTILTLQGKLGQADSWLEFQDSTGGILGAFNASGNFAIGSVGSATDALFINKTFTADTGAFNNAIGVNVTNNQTSGFAILTALNLTAIQASGVGTLPVCTTLLMGAVASSAGTFLNGFFVGAQFGMSSTVAQTGGIADAYIFNLVSPVYNGSKPALNFGINILNQGHAGVVSSSAIFISAQSGSTNNYGILSNANILIANPTSGLGYTGGSGGAVTQATSKSTGVTLNTVAGQITMNNATLNAGTSVAFTLTNSNITANDAVWVTFKSGNTANSYTVQTDSTGTGSCTISLRNYTGGNLGEAVVLNFVIIKGASA
jgi:hypothetical protein